MYVIHIIKVELDNRNPGVQPLLKKSGNKPNLPVPEHATVPVFVMLHIYKKPLDGLPAAQSFPLPRSRSEKACRDIDYIFGRAKDVPQGAWRPPSAMCCMSCMWAACSWARHSHTVFTVLSPVPLLLNSSRHHDKKGHQELHLLCPWVLSVEISHWEPGDFPTPCKQTDSELGVSLEKLEGEFGMKVEKICNDEFFLQGSFWAMSEICLHRADKRPWYSYLPTEFTESQGSCRLLIFPRGNVPTSHTRWLKHWRWKAVSKGHWCLSVGMQQTQQGTLGWETCWKSRRGKNLCTELKSEFPWHSSCVAWLNHGHDPCVAVTNMVFLWKVCVCEWKWATLVWRGLSR